MNVSRLQEVWDAMHPLEGTKPITKKDACARLGIAYNTTRLDKILQEFKDKQGLDQRLRKQRAGKPANDYEYQAVLEGYLRHDSIAEISRNIHRTTTFVRNLLWRVGIPHRPQHKVPYLLIDEGIAKEHYRSGDMAYSAVHQDSVEIRREAHSALGTCYWCYLIDGQANVPIMWWDLIPLNDLIEKYKLKIKITSDTNCSAVIAETLSKVLKYAHRD